MAKALVPIYECDLCGHISKNPFDVRVFNGLVSDGENYIFSDDSIMVGVPCGCIIGHLQLGEKPKQKQIQIRKPAPKPEPETISEHEILEPPVEVVEDDPIYPDLDAPDIDDPVDTGESLGLTNPDDIFDRIIEEKQEDLKPVLREDQEGKYFVLRKINTENDESELIASLGHVSIESFKKNAYDKSLVGVYVAVMLSADEIIEKVRKKTVSFIDNIIMGGIPHITESELDVSLDGQRAYITQDDYNNARRYFTKPKSLQDILKEKE
jgi:hypothetical protein